jgi:hypothetical protein
MENSQLIETLQRNNQLLEELNMRLDLIMGGHNQFLIQLPGPGEKLMDRLDVQEYLGISPTTYKRKVKQGKLKPMDLPGGHKYRKGDLLAEHNESIRRGRV